MFSMFFWKEMYSIKITPLVVHDIMIYEIKRPMTPIPYSVFVYNFSLCGHQQMFRDLFTVPSWASPLNLEEQAADIEFCNMLWKGLGLKEKFSPSSVVPSPSRLPSIYRRDVYSVLLNKYGSS